MAESACEGSRWLRSLSRFGLKPGLDRTRRVLRQLGNPETGLNFFHIAGTNGKGSTCAVLSALCASRLRVGTFTSPAFDGYRGRFVVANQVIPDAAFETLALQVKRVTEAMAMEDPITEFEALTVMAILYFRQEQVDAAVWETGLGGRFDATNVVQPQVTAITNVSYDHVEILGPTLRDIAFEKSGIIKPGVPVVTGATGVALDVVQAAATQANSPLYIAGRDFGITRRVLGGKQELTYRGLDGDLYGLPLPLWGLHQADNAAIALVMYELGVRQGGCPKLLPAEVRRALRTVFWPGRFEVSHLDGMLIVLDGAHNPDGASRFASALQEYSEQQGIPANEWTMIIGLLNDKDADPMLHSVLPLATEVIATQPDSPRAKNADVLANDIRRVYQDIQMETASTVHEALRIALSRHRPICCWGSLYTVDEARKAMEQSRSLWE